MKRVSFKVAKEIKEAGYPQDITCGYLFDAKGNPCDEYTEGDIFVRPTYIEVRLWLWREKKIAISEELWYDKPNDWGSIIECDTIYKELYGYNDPEEAIIAAIEYLVDNDLMNFTKQSQIHCEKFVSN